MQIKGHEHKYLKIKAESLLIAIKDVHIRINYVKTKIDETN